MLGGATLNSWYKYIEVWVWTLDKILDLSFSVSICAQYLYSSMKNYLKNNYNYTTK